MLGTSLREQPAEDGNQHGYQCTIDCNKHARGPFNSPPDELDHFGTVWLPGFAKLPVGEYDMADRRRKNAVPASQVRNVARTTR